MLKLPRFAPGKGKPFDRRKFLDGTLRCCFGPRQPALSGGTYKNPGDWTPARRLLRRPQVVRLGLYFQDGTSGDYVMTWKNYWSTPQYSGEIATNINGQNLYGDQNFTTTTVPNQNATEHARLVTAFQDAKAAIESLRPGRTWVEVVDWNAGLPDGDLPNLLVPIAAPEDYLADGSFLPCDFLNLWAGHGLFLINGTPVVYNPYTPSNPLDADPNIGDPKAKLVANEKMLGRYGAKLYHADMTWPDASPSPDPSAVTSQGYTDIPAEQRSLESNTSSLFDSLASDMTGLSCAHPGGTSGLTKEVIISLVAGFFGFDAGTGKDNPLASIPGPPGSATGNGGSGSGSGGGFYVSQEPIGIPGDLSTDTAALD